MFLLSHDLSQVRQKGDLGNEVDGMKGDTFVLLNSDDGMPKRGVLCVSHKRVPRSAKRAEPTRSLLKRSSPQSMRRFLWSCDSTPTAPRGVFSLPIVETQKSRWNVEHVLVGFCSIEYVDAAHQKVAQGRNVPCSLHCSEYVVLSPVVKVPVASTLFFLAGG